MEKKIIKAADYLQDEEHQLIFLVKHQNVSEKLDIHFKEYWEFKYPEIDDGEVVAPEAQADLADKFLSINKNCIVETHSDHIINRLERRIVEDGLDGEAVGLINKVQIYFLEKNEDTKEVVFTKVEMNENGDIAKWPEGFFDQAYNDDVATVKAANRKRRNNAT